MTCGAAVAAAKTVMRLRVAPARVHPGGAISLQLRSSQRRCRLTITDQGRVIFRITIRRGRTVIPFSANSAAAHIVLHVRCGRRTQTRRVSVVLLRARPAPPAPTPPPVTTPVTPPVTTPVTPPQVTSPSPSNPPAGSPSGSGSKPGSGSSGSGGNGNDNGGNGNNNGGGNGNNNGNGSGSGSGGSGSQSGSGSTGSNSSSTPAAKPTTSETAAVTWASKWVGSSYGPGFSSTSMSSHIRHSQRSTSMGLPEFSSAQYSSGLSLLFTYLAYDLGAGLNLEQLTSGVLYSLTTDAQNVWGHTSGGTTGTGTPPYGSIVFFTAKSGYSPAQYSFVGLMGSGGEMITTPDTFNSRSIHDETLAQAATCETHSSYAGWWLPDGGKSTTIAHAIRARSRAHSSHRTRR